MIGGFSRIIGDTPRIIGDTPRTIGDTPRTIRDTPRMMDGRMSAAKDIRMMSSSADIDDPESMQGLLSRLMSRLNGRRVDVASVERMNGHSGITYSFEAALDDSGPSRLVIRVPPVGVRQQHSADVLRTVPYLQLMSRSGIRVPAVRYWGRADEDFPVPYLIVDHCPGTDLGDAFGGPLKASGERIRVLFDQAASELSAIHHVSVPAELGPPRSLRDEIDLWVPTLHKAQDPAWVDAGMALHRRLLDSMPGDPPVGVVHGDYYSNNLLFVDDRLSAVLDWENVFVGPRLLDVGWLCMMYDPQSWGPTRRHWMADGPDGEDLLQLYAAHSGESLERIGFYRALAGFRLASITAHNLRLHRLGRRHDPSWEVFGEAFMDMIDRGHELLDRDGR